MPNIAMIEKSFSRIVWLITLYDFLLVNQFGWSQGFLIDEDISHMHGAAE